MANQLEDAFNVNGLKEECQDDLTDEKVHISETAIAIGHAEDHLIPDKVKLHDIPTTLDHIKTELSSSEVQYKIMHDNLKIEEGISTDHIKTEFNNGLLYCEDCQVFREDYCGKCKMIVHILNGTGNKLREELPKYILEIRDYLGEHRVFALKVIPVGVKFGPFTGLNTTALPWKIKRGKFVISEDKSKYLNWMQHINPARNISEQNLLVFQYKHNLYYRSTHQIEVGDELLVYFGEEYDDNLNRNVEMNFIPAAEHIFKDAFACTYCCLGFSSKPYLAKHKAICPGNVGGGFLIEELVHCPSCKVHLDRKEYITHHMAYCCKINDRKCTLPTPDNRTVQVSGRKTRQQQLYKCQRCKYSTKYKGDLNNHSNQHYEVKMYKCADCCKRFKTKEILRQHVQSTRVCAGEKRNWERFTGTYMNARIKTEDSCSQNDVKQFKCLSCEFRTKYKASLRRHVAVKHLKKFIYKCDRCNYKANEKSWLNTHMRTKHLQEFKYKCEMCDYKAHQKCQLKTHVETKHLKRFTYKCDRCDYQTNIKNHLRRHVETRHLKDFKYKCDTCDHKSSQKSRLKIHIVTKHLKEFKYKCDTCDYKTNEKFMMKRHADTRHAKEFKYKCDRCDYKTNWKPCLKKHTAARHLKEFQYKCEWCYYKTYLKSCLKTHIDAKHLKEFKYKCDRCDYKANLKSSLKRHIEGKHLKQFKYKCESCDYKTYFKSCLKTHIKARHLKESKYKCDTCDYKTYFKSCLQTHMKVKHFNEFKYECDYKGNMKSQ